jgi:uncharacterized protein
MEQDMGGTSVLCGLLIVGLFLWFQRSFRQFAALGLSLLLILALTLGAYGWFIGQMGIVSAGFAAILMGLCVDYAMILAREVQSYGSIQKARQHCRAGILWGAITTAAPFLVLTASIMPGGKQLGFLVAVGLLIGAAVMLWLFPRLAFGKVIRTQRFLLPITPLSARAAWVTLCVLMSIMASGLFLLRDRLTTSFDMALLQPRECQAMLTLKKLQTLFPAWNDDTVYLFSKGQVDDAQAEAQLRQMQSEGLITQWLLPPTLLPDEAPFRENQQSLLADPNWLSRIQQALTAKGFSPAASELYLSLLTHAKQWPHAQAAFSAIQNHSLLKGHYLPATSTQPAVSLGAVRLQAGSSAATAHAALHRLESTGLTASSWSLLRYELQPLLARDAQTLLIPMLVVLILSLCAALRNLPQSLIAMSLMVLILGTTLLVLVMLQPTGLHFLHLLGLVVLCGSSIDYMLHMLFAQRRGDSSVPQTMGSTGMAIIFCAVSTAIGFGSLSLASNPAMASLGLLTAFGILFAMLCTLFLLPGLCAGSIEKQKAI